MEPPARRRTPLRRAGNAVVAFALLVAALAGLKRVFMTPSPEPASGAEVPAIAVVPLSGDSALSEQITRQFIDLLQQAGLRTQGWLSVNRYVDTTGVADVLRDHLGVEYVVEGNVRLADDGVGLLVSLTDSHDGTVLWSDEFVDSMRALSDYEVRAVQAMVGRIANHEGQDPEAYRIRRYTRNPVADSLYSFVKYQLSNSYNPVALQRAEDDLRTAIDADSGFAPAYVELAGVLLQQSRLYWKVDPREHQNEILELLLEAKELAPDLPSAYTELGWYYYGIARDYDQALRYHEKAIRLAPHQSLARTGYAFPLIATGKVDSALAVVRYASDLEPMNPMVVSTECWIQYMANRLEDALRTCTFVTDSIDPGYEVALKIEDLVSTLLMVQRGDTAGLARKRRAFEADPSAIGEQDLNFEHGVAFYWAAVGDTAHALATLDDEKTRPDVRPLRIANGYATIGMMDTAFVWLDRAIDLRDPLVPEITVRPFMEPFRRDPRYAEVLRKLGLDRYFPDVMARSLMGIGAPQ